MVQLLEELSTLLHNAGRVENKQSLISEHYKDETPLRRLVQSGNCSFCLNYSNETSFFYEARLSSMKDSK
jgi:hypothetical protein